MPVTSATVTIPLEDLDALRAAKQAAENEAADLRTKLVESLQTDRTGVVKELNTLVRDCLVVVRFAIANLPPETTRRWPTTALRAILEALPKVPDASVDDKAFIIEMRQFRKDIAEFDRFRVARDEDEKRKAEIEAGLDADPTMTDPREEPGHIDIKY
jgi:hypothetical protein